MNLTYTISDYLVYQDSTSHNRMAILLIQTMHYHYCISPTLMWEQRYEQEEALH